MLAIEPSKKRDEDREVWENYAATDAYWSVLTQEKYRAGALDDKARAEFFETGEQDVDKLWSVFKEQFGADPRPRQALDYGCGVGRLLIPIAKRCEAAVGVDIAEGMLDEARRNLADGHVKNARVTSVDEFNAANDTYDLIHSYIVLQHIDPSIGYGVISTMLERLETGGYGMIHVTYKRRTNLVKRVWNGIKVLPGARSIRKRRMESRPGRMAMHEYSLPRVFGLLDAAGCTERFVVPTFHGFFGKMIYFRKG